jgi:predicted metal-dependent hydrolase
MPDRLEPPCKIRRSRRARHILLRVTPEDGLVATLPWRATKKALRQAISEHAAWIDEQLLHVAAERERLLEARQTRPEVLELRASGQILQLHYSAASGSRHRLMKRDNTLHIHMPDIQDTAAAHHQLGNFVRREARQFLGDRLETLAERHGLVYSGLSIRRQKTRWGSCSAKKRINLNDRLMFLPEPLMEHVLLHELAHTRHLDHSPRFHALLTKLDPRTKEHRKALRHAGQYIPEWF